MRTYCTAQGVGGCKYLFRTYIKLTLKMHSKYIRYRQILFDSTYMMYLLLLLLLSHFSGVRLCVAAATAKLLQSCLTVQSHRRQPTRLPRPWDSPGKNTGMGCHFLLQCMKMKSESEVAQSCPTLSDPMDCSPPGSSIHGIFQARVLEWVAIGQKT